MHTRKPKRNVNIVTRTGETSGAAITEVCGGTATIRSNPGRGSVSEEKTKKPEHGRRIDWGGLGKKVEQKRGRTGFKKKRNQLGRKILKGNHNIKKTGQNVHLQLKKTKGIRKPKHLGYKGNSTNRRGK